MLRIKHLLTLGLLWLLLIGCSSELLVRFWVHHVYQSPLPTPVNQPFTEVPEMPAGIRPGKVLYMHANFSGVAANGVRYTTNAWAFRDDPVDMSQQHVVFLGDSATFGLNIPHEATYAEVWERLKGPGWQAINTAMPGRGTINEYDILNEVLQRGVQPTWVVVGFFANDPWNNTYYDHEPESQGVLDHLYTAQIATALWEHTQVQKQVTFDSHAAVTEHAKALWQDKAWQTSLRYLGYIRDRAAQVDAKTLILYIPVNTTEALNGSAAGVVLRRYTDQENIPFINGVDVYQAYLQAHNLTTIPATFYSAPGDMGHPGILASELLGQAVYARMQPG